MHVITTRKTERGDSKDLEHRRSESLAKIGSFIARLQEADYFGKVTISIQNGVVVDARIEQVLKLDDIG